MRYFLGTHMVNWLGDTRFEDVPLFISRVRLKDRKSFPRAVTDWALDSGGFSEIAKYGTWTLTPQAYVSEVRKYAKQIGRMQWAAIQDWMCEPVMLEKTGLTIEEHQTRTIESYLTLVQLAPEIHWIPILQGWEMGDYLRHVQQYAAVGIDLTTFPTVGVGSVCRRQGTVEAERIITQLHSMGLNIHAFGFKITGLANVADIIISADSMAWSDNARHNAPLAGHTHKSCANCPDWALLWYDKNMGVIERCKRRPRQLALWN